MREARVNGKLVGAGQEAAGAGVCPDGGEEVKRRQRRRKDRRRHLPLSAQTWPRKGWRQAMLLDVTDLDTADRHGVYCEAATDCAARLNGMGAPLQSSS
jgi:hypothetical protein